MKGSKHTHKHITIIIWEEEELEEDANEIPYGLCV